MPWGGASRLRRPFPARVSGWVRLVSVLFVLGVLPSGAYSEPGHHPVNASLLYPISTNRDPAVSTNFCLNLLYGRVGALHGVDLSGVYGRVDGPVRGVQVTGLLSTVTGTFRGASLTGLVNYGGGDARGIQVSGLVNYGRGNFSGIQYAGFFNFVEQDFRGVQLTTLYNLASQDARWVQVSSVVNAVAGHFEGIQLSGGINYVQEDVKGFQVGLAAFAASFRGAQVGLVNFTGKAQGLQLGLVNVARQNEGHAFGLVNYADNGGVDWVSFATNLAAFNTGVRTSLRGFYSMFTAGLGDVQEERGDTGFFTWNYGYGFALTSGWTLDADLGFVHIIPRKSDDPNETTRLHYAGQARVLGEYRWSPRTALFFGGGLSAIVSEYSMDATTEYEPLAGLGISLF